LIIPENMFRGGLEKIRKKLRSVQIVPSVRIASKCHVLVSLPYKHDP
jgi:hypothetical protein